jgi:hypothetical protein
LDGRRSVSVAGGAWHIADELAPKLRAKGFKGMLVTPLPVPRVI